MSLVVRKNVQNEITIFTLKGILDITTSHVIDPYLDELGDISILILDFSELEFIDSTGIGSIINAIYLSKEKNFILQLQGIDELTGQVFETVGLYQILNTIQEEVV